jgi:hypothetical protein
MVERAPVTGIDAAGNFARSEHLGYRGMIFREGRTDRGVVHGGCQINMRHPSQIGVVELQRGLQPPPRPDIEIIPRRPSKDGRDQPFDGIHETHRQSPGLGSG